jgi:hypothetical protein
MNDLTPLSERTSLTDEDRRAFKSATANQDWLLNSPVQSAGRAGKGFVGKAKVNYSEKMQAAFNKFDSALKA